MIRLYKFILPIRPKVEVAAAVLVQGLVASEILRSR